MNKLAKNANGWDALAVKLPKRAFSGKTPSPSTVSTNINNFPFHPAKVRELSLDNFLECVKDHGFVDHLSGINTTEDLGIRFRIYEEENLAGAAGDEIGTSGYIQTDLRVIFSYCTRMGLLDDFPCCFSGASDAVGDPDLKIGHGKPDDGTWNGPEVLTIVGEVKTNKEKEKNFAHTFCDVGCKECKYKGPNGKMSIQWKT